MGFPWHGGHIPPPLDATTPQPGFLAHETHPSARQASPTTVSEPSGLKSFEVAIGPPHTPP